MLQAMLAGVASIKAQQTRMNVIGNNLANVNTTAYKGSRVTFQDMIAQTIRGASRPTDSMGGTNPVQFGLGVLVAGTDINSEQGSLNATNRPTDLAIQGSGFFIVSDGDGISYTRDGGFDLDAQGYMVHRATGQRLIGWQANGLGQVDTTAPLTPDSFLNIPLGALNAVQATTEVSFAGNLNGNAIATDSWTTQVRVYDSLGGPHDLTVEFTNRQSPAAGTPPSGAVSSWEWTAYEGGVGGTVIGTSADTGNSRMYFDTNGNLVGGNLGTATVPASTGSSPFPLSLNFDRISQLKTDTQVNPSNQNGFPPGSLQGFSISGDGVITGLFTNGLTRTMGQISMAVFPNPGGLQRLGNNLWQATDNTGIPVTGVPQTGGRGSVSSGFLEQSNIDIGNEFTDLIITQRGFQANTRVVTTVDEMLQDLLNMKR